MSIMMRLARFPVSCVKLSGNARPAMYTALRSITVHGRHLSSQPSTGLNGQEHFSTQPNTTDGIEAEEQAADVETGVPFSETKAYKMSLDEVFGTDEETVAKKKREARNAKIIWYSMLTMVVVFALFIPGEDVDLITMEKTPVPCGLVQIYNGLMGIDTPRNRRW